MTIKEVLSIIATLIAFVGIIPYLIDTIKSKVKPHPYTWLVWSIVTGVTFLGGVEQGAGIAAMPVGVAELLTIIIFLFSLKNGFKNIKEEGKYFLITALLGLIPWIITRNATISIVIMVLIDVIAFIPTFRKTWQYPETEKSGLYLSNVVRHILILLSLQSYNIATMLHSIVMLVTNSLMMWIIGRKR